MCMLLKNVFKALCAYVYVGVYLGNVFDMFICYLHYISLI